MTGRRSGGDPKILGVARERPMPHAPGVGGDAMVRAERAARAVARACEEATTVVELCRGVRREIDPVVPSDRWCAFAVDPPTMISTNGYHDEGVDERLLPRLLDLEHGADDLNHLPALARIPGGVASITDASGGDPAISARWRDVLAPSGVPFELRAVFRAREQVWGALVLMRGSDAGDFTREEAGFVSRISTTVADGFRRVLVRQHLDHAQDAREAGILLLGGDRLEVRTATSAARAWLDELDDGTFGGGLPTVVRTAALSARRDGAGPVAVRARTRNGRWLTITAERTTDGDGDGGVGVGVGVIVQPSRPAEVALVLSAAHGLTRRETDVVLLVASGRTNQEIARLLDVSPYTVADHLKAVFAKVGVASRGELTSKLFYDHYLGRAMAGLPAGADGWFLPG